MLILVGFLLGLIGLLFIWEALERLSSLQSDFIKQFWNEAFYRAPSSICDCEKEEFIKSLEEVLQKHKINIEEIWNLIRADFLRPLYVGFVIFLLGLGMITYYFLARYDVLEVPKYERTEWITDCTEMCKRKVRYVCKDLPLSSDICREAEVLDEKCLH